MPGSVSRKRNDAKLQGARTNGRRCEEIGLQIVYRLTHHPVALLERALPGSGGNLGVRVGALAVKPFLAPANKVRVFVFVFFRFRPDQ